MQAIASARAITRANQEKGSFGQAMKSPPKGKAVWADIACAKLLIARPEFMLIDLKKFILN